MEDEMVGWHHRLNGHGSGGLQYFGHLMQRTDSLEKTLMLGKIENKREESMRWLDGITNSMNMSWVDSGSW